MADEERSSPSSAVMAMTDPTGIDFDPSEICQSACSVPDRKSERTTNHDLGEDSIVLRLDIHRRLVRFLSNRSRSARGRRCGDATHNFDQNVSRRKGFALLLLPGRDTSLRHGRTHRGHGELGEGLRVGGGMNLCFLIDQSAKRSAGLARYRKCCTHVEMSSERCG